MELTPEEGRVLGCLVEKQLTTPQQYPLTDKALIAACNQTTSRDPVVDYDLTAVRVAVRSLREKGLVRTVHRSGERSDKHQHELPAVLDLSAAQVAVLAVLLLRGPQTAAELRARTERMHPFGSVEEVEEVLAALVDRTEPLAARLPRQPGRREDRFAEALVEVPGGAATARPDRPGASDAREAAQAGEAPEPGQAPDRPDSSDSTAAGERPPPSSVPWGAAPVTGLPAGPPDVPTTEVLAREVAALRDEVAALRAEVAALRS